MDQEYIKNSIHLLKELIDSEKNRTLRWHPDKSKYLLGTVILELDYVHYEHGQKWHVLEYEYAIHIFSDGKFKLTQTYILPENLRLSADILDELIKKWIKQIHPMNRQLIRTNVFRSELVSKVLYKDIIALPEYMIDLF